MSRPDITAGEPGSAPRRAARLCRACGRIVSSPGGTADRHEVYGGRCILPVPRPDGRQFGPWDEITAQHWAGAFLARQLREWCQRTGRSVPGGPVSSAAVRDPESGQWHASPAHLAVLADYLECHPPAGLPGEAEIREALSIGQPALRSVA